MPKLLSALLLVPTVFLATPAHAATCDAPTITRYGPASLTSALVGATAVYVAGHFSMTVRDLRTGEHRRFRVPGEPNVPELHFEPGSWKAWALVGRDLATIRLDPRCPKVTP
ncbi:hypothetical protein [Nonomuraea dietziae]|uniref:hypothetical protein n=1 Tax=Nonomuraea dietziae TaxID=65515 RepID=UPI0034114FA1